jgi:hypothetical protein
MHPFLLLALASFAFIGLRAFQQLNVMHHRIAWVVPTSGLMAITEVTILVNAVQQGWWSWVPMFIGGSTGCVVSMLLHKRLRDKENASR